ncbi:MAG TPA: RND family transporter [candidate division WOR-3 bacterium]|uniref:RND family transporter n=1 Tax=candidate division WOR-3 bacterium TaxID=2052148 RepID=A0A9C9JZS2_UNCW3|nr:RND family transporter [candidate division WOR-3 bacterium]
MKYIVDFVIKYNKWVIVVTLCVTAVFGYFLKDIRINPDITSYLPEDEEVVRLFNYVGEEYGGNLLAMVVIETDDLFNRETIKQISELTSELLLLDGVSSVTSLSNILDIRAGDEGIEIRPLIDEYDLPTTVEELKRLKKYVLSKNIYRGSLVSDDAQATLIVCRLQGDADEVETARAIKEVVREKELKEKIYFGGLPFLMLDINNIVVKDLLFLLPLVGLLIIFALFISFRTVRGVVFPLISVLMSCVWTIGLMSLLKIPLTIITNIIPIILFAVGSAYSIHVISKLSEQDQISGVTPEDYYKERLKSVILPVALAASTTIIGFLSFILGSYLNMIKEFGIFAGVGIFSSFIISVTFIPAALSVLKRSDAAGHLKDEKQKLLIRKNRLTEMIIKRPLPFILFGIIFVVASLFGIPRIQREVDLLDYFKKGTAIRSSEEVIKQKFGGSMPIQILVKGEIQSPEVLKAMKEMERFLDAQDGVHNIQSVADLIEEMSYVIGEGRKIPDTRAKVTNLWFLLEGEEIMAQLVDPEYTEAVIQATLGSGLEIHKVKRLVEALDGYIKEKNSPFCSFEQTGMPLVHLKLDESIRKSQLQSLAIAAISIFILLLFLLRSLSGGLIGLIPIGFSLSVVFGAMGYFNIPLDIATVLVGSICIGIGVDYSIHFLARYRLEFRKKKEVNAAVLKTLQTTGKAIVINVLTVTIGFLVLLFANLIPLQRFGVLIAVTMLGSGFGAVVIIPAVIVLSRIHFIKERRER